MFIFSKYVALILSVPIEIEDYPALHFKALVNGKVEPRGPEHGGIFILKNTRSEIGHLLHILGHFDSDMHTTVYLHFALNISYLFSSLTILFSMMNSNLA